MQPLGRIGLARCANVLRSPAGLESWELEAAQLDENLDEKRQILPEVQQISAIFSNFTDIL